MTEIVAAQHSARADELQRRWVLIACILATCARNSEPPLWIYRPPAVDAFHQSWNTFSLATGLFNLSMLGLVLMGGVLGDLFGRRRVLLIGLGGWVAANVLFFLGPAVPWFIFTRLLTGAFGALIPPIALSILYLTYAELPEARTRAIGIYVLVTMSVFLLSGPLGLITYQALAWRAPMVLPTVLGIIALVMVLRTTTESRVHHERRSDVIGHTAWALVVLSASGSFVAWLGSGAYASLGLALAVVGLLVGVGLLFWWGRQTRDSILGSARVKRRALIVLILFGLAMQFGFVGFVLQVRNSLLAVYDYGSVLATIALAPLLVGMLLMTLYADRRLVTVEPRRLMAAGLLGGGSICAVAALTQAVGFYPWLALVLTAFGASMVLATITWTAVFLIAVPEDVVGVRTGINSAVFQMGGTLGGTIPGALLVQYGVAAYSRLLVAAGVPPEQIGDAVEALNTLLDPAAYGALLPPDISSRLIAGYQIAYLDAFNRVLLIIALVCAIGAALVWFGLQRRAGSEEP